MKSFGYKLKELRKENGLTQDYLIDLVEKKFNRKISKSMISKWENGQSEPEKFSDAAAIAVCLGVSADYLTGLTENKYGDEKKDVQKKVNILGTIAAGIPIAAQEDILGFEYVNSSDHIDFCLKVKGSSMIGARIFDGDIVFIHQQEEVENGEIAAIQIDGEEATLKRFYRDYGKVTLHSENPTIPDMIFTSKDKKQIKVLGKVTYVKFEAR